MGWTRRTKEKGMRKKGWVSYRMSPRIEHLGRNIKFTLVFCYVMKKGQRKNPPKNTQNRPKKGQGHPKERAKKKGPPQKRAPGSLIFGEGGVFWDLFFFGGSFF